MTDITQGINNNSTNKRTVLFQTDFSGGELTTTFQGNYTFELYKNSVKQCINFDASAYEGLSTRQGTLIYSVTDVKQITSSWGDNVIIFNNKNIKVVSREVPFTEASATISGDAVDDINLATQYIQINESPDAITFYIRQPLSTLNPNGGFLTLRKDSTSLTAVFKKLSYSGTLPAVADVKFNNQKMLLIAGTKLFISKLGDYSTFADVPESSSSITSGEAFSINLSSSLTNDNLLSLEATQDYIVVVSTSNYFVLKETDSTNALLVYKKFTQSHQLTSRAKAFEHSGKVYVLGDRFIDVLEYNDATYRVEYTNLSKFCAHIFTRPFYLATHKTDGNDLYLYILRIDGSLYKVLVESNNKPRNAAAYQLDTSPIMSERTDACKIIDITHTFISMNTFYNGKYYLEFIPKEKEHRSLNRERQNFHYQIEPEMKRTLSNHDYLDKSSSVSSVCYLSGRLFGNSEVRAPIPAGTDVSDFVVGAVVEFVYRDPLTKRVVITGYKIRTVNITSDVIALTFTTIGDQPFDIVNQNFLGDPSPSVFQIVGIRKKQVVSQAIKDIYTPLLDSGQVIAKTYTLGIGTITHIEEIEDLDNLPDCIHLTIGIGYRSMVNILPLGDPRAIYTIQQMTLTLTDTPNNALNIYVAKDDGGSYDYNKITYEFMISDFTDKEIRENPTEFCGVMTNIPTKMNINTYDVDLTYNLNNDFNSNLYIFSSLGQPINILNFSMSFR